MKKLLILSAIIALLGFVLIGCQQNPDSSSGSGELAMFLADKPVNDVAKVLVTIDEVQVKRDDTQWETINDFAEEENGEKQFDLMTLRFDEELLGQENLSAGQYNQIRLIVAADENNSNRGPNSGKSKVVYKEESDKSDEDIFIPSGTQTGLKINHNFEITEDTITRLVLDADVSNIMHEAGNSDNIILRPTSISVIDKVVSGNIKGKVIAEDTSEAITDSDVVVEALDDNDEVVTSTVALAEDDPESGEPAGTFLLRGLEELEEGTYSVKAYVADDESNYTETTVDNVEVTAEDTTELDEDIVLNNTEE